MLNYFEPFKLLVLICLQFFYNVLVTSIHQDLCRRQCSGPINLFTTKTTKM